MRTVYVSGPMAGYPSMNEPAFRSAEDAIWERGDEPLIPHDLLPHEHDGVCPKVYGDGSPGGHGGGCYLRGDLAAMLDKATSLYVLPGWSRSRGAQIEVLVARLLRIPIEYHPDAERGGSAVEVLADVYDEINRQDAKWGNILDEEVAEAYAETGPELSTELVQVAAVAVQRAAQARRNQPRKENPDEPQD